MSRDEARAEVARLAARPAPAWDEVPDVAPGTREMPAWPDATESLPEPVKPSREAVARALAEHRLMGGRCRCGLDPRLDYYRYEQHVTGAVLSLLPGRSEAEVKAEALNEAADWLADMDDGRDTGQHRAGRDIIARLRDRAARAAAEGGADRG